MNDSPNAEQPGRWGLCASCAHAKVIVSDRGAAFVQCALAKGDPRFARYPTLPVRRCAGFDKKRQKQS